MARYLKRGMDASAIKAADAKVRATVEQILADVEAAARRSGARAFAEVRQMVAAHRSSSRRRRSSARSARSASATSTTSSSRRRRCATSPQKQSETLRDLEVETLPGVILGHRHIPVSSIGCYVPGGRYPMVASAHMSIVTARVAGVQAHHRLRAAVQGRAASGHRRRHAFRRRRRDLTCSAACRRSPPWRSAPRRSRRST